MVILSGPVEMLREDWIVTCFSIFSSHIFYRFAPGSHVFYCALGPCHSVTLGKTYGWEVLDPRGLQSLFPYLLWLISDTSYSDSFLKDGGGLKQPGCKRMFLKLDLINVTASPSCWQEALNITVNGKAKHHSLTFL